MTDPFRHGIFGSDDAPQRAAEAGAQGFSADTFDEIIDEDIRESDQFLGGRGSSGSGQGGGAPAMMPPMMMGGAGRGGAPAGGAGPAGATGSAAAGSTGLQPGAGGTLATGQGAGAHGLPGGVGAHGAGLPGGVGAHGAGLPGGLGGAGGVGLPGAAGLPGGRAGLGAAGIPGGAALRGNPSGGFSGGNGRFGGIGAQSSLNGSGFGPGGLNGGGANGLNNMGRSGGYPGAQSGRGGGRNDFNVKPDELRTEATRWQEVGKEMQTARRKMADLDVSHETFGKIRRPYPSYELAKQTSRSKADASVTRSEQNSSSLTQNANMFEQSDALAARLSAF